MTLLKLHQPIPTAWQEREKLRDKGQFWTPQWIAKAMVGYLLDDTDLIFDPAVGTGAFYSALCELEIYSRKVKFYGTDIDEHIINQSINDPDFQTENCHLEIRDFISNPPARLFKSIVANPPYIRHHRLSLSLKEKLKEISLKALGETIDGRAGLHIYFLIQALRLLKENGKLAFIVPADTCEGIFSRKLWDWISKKYCLEAVITFSPKATPFPKVDTNAVVLLIKNAPPTKEIFWVETLQADTDELCQFVLSRFQENNFPTLNIIKRNLNEAISTGLTRKPNNNVSTKYKLFDFAKVVRGVATGANEYFFLTKEQAKKLGIPKQLLKSAIGRTRDVSASYINKQTLIDLESRGRPTLLFSPDGRKLQDFSKEVRRYLLKGEKKGVNKQTLIATRNPWYKMEQRLPPVFLFTYLGRRNARFIKNDAGVIPLTCFLCVYPHKSDQSYIEKLWAVLQHPDTLRNLPLVGKSYGSGAIKVEPRALQNLPIPEHVIDELKFYPIKTQKELFEQTLDAKISQI